MTRPPGGGSGVPPEIFAQMFTPKPYQSISELLGVMANVLIYGERSTDEEFRSRYLKLFDVVQKGLTIYMDNEFMSPKGFKPNVVLEIDKKELKEAVISEIKDPGEKPVDTNHFDIDPDVDN